MVVRFMSEGLYISLIAGSFGLLATVVGFAVHQIVARMDRIQELLQAHLEDNAEHYRVIGERISRLETIVSMRKDYRMHSNE